MKGIYPICISCPLHSQLGVQLVVLHMQIHMQIPRKMTPPGFRSLFMYCTTVNANLSGVQMQSFYNPILSSAKQSQLNALCGCL